jgi:hypothetical protein
MSAADTDKSIHHEGHEVSTKKIEAIVVAGSMVCFVLLSALRG